MRATLVVVVVVILSVWRVALAETLTVTDVTVVDTGGGPAQLHRDVVLRDGRIAAVEPAAARTGKTVDGRGRYLIPGLWDMHVHLSWARASALPVLVANGVTSVRDMGGHLREIDEWRTRIEAGALVGPRIVRAGPILNGQVSNPLHLLAGDPAQTRAVARTLAHVGVDFLKVHRRMPRESYFALLDEAKKLGLTVAGHIPMTVTPEEASDRGQATIEHTETLFEGTFSAKLSDKELPDAIRKFRERGAKQLFARFVKNKTALTPTIYALTSIVAAVAGPPDPRQRYVARSMKELGRKLIQSMSPEQVADTRRQIAELREVVRELDRSGVVLLAGTDLAASRLPGFGLHEELALLCDAGLSPLEALQAATLAPARVLGKEADLGSVAKGKLADLVLLAANPLDDIHNVARIDAVIVGGKLLARADLDALLRQAEKLAATN